MRISDKLQSGIPSWSFEYFPPKTNQGLQNLYNRMERMYELGPAFIDITWNAGGRLSNLTCEMVATAQAAFGLETCMHLTCTGMPKEKVDYALKGAYEAGCQNILALRGDPPKEDEWKTPSAEFRYASDLVQHIRTKYGDYFCIVVAGYPEGHPDEPSEDTGIQHLKQKIEAGGSLIITQMFYDVDKFLSWVQKCRQAGISCPIIPGIMPIQTWAAFIRRAKWSGCSIPQSFMDELEPVKDDDAALRAKGTRLIVKMCQKMLDAGIGHLHFYTMNLEQATKMVLKGLGLVPSKENLSPLPWRQSLSLRRKEENVRPIFWKYREKSYVARTQHFDEFPNGRWGDSRSPAFGELDYYGIGLKCSNEAAVQQWGTPTKLADIANLFANYCLGQVSSLPWSDVPISPEADSIVEDLVKLNKQGFLTINSQPAVNGKSSSHKVYGWGPRNGYVYQKAYLEFFVHPSVLNDLISSTSRDSYNSFYAVCNSGDLKTNTLSDGPNAVTWGVFPGKEILQPTIVEPISFLAWKDEAYRLGYDWAKCYPPNSPSRKLINEIMDTWFLMNIVHNDYHNCRAIFEIFENTNTKVLSI